VPPEPSHYPTLCADPDRGSVVVEYLDAWRNRAEARQAFLEARARLLGVYAQAYSDLPQSADGAAYDRRIRLLWDLCGVAHATSIRPEAIKRALRWKEPQAPGEASTPPVSLADASQHPLRTRPGSLPDMVRRLLRSVVLDRTRGVSFEEYVSTRVRQVYLTPELVEWSPACPLDVCGSCEPLTRTLILASVTYVDLSPKPDWSLAAVAVHESAHIEWFHRPEVSHDPRLLFPAPNERNAWLLMSRFLSGLLDADSPPVRRYVGKHAAEIRVKLRQAESYVRAANRLLKLPEDDESVHPDLPAGVSEDDLGRDAVAAGGEP
jgi:hypothetical protein